MVPEKDKQIITMGCFYIIRDDLTHRIIIEGVLKNGRSVAALMENPLFSENNYWFTNTFKIVGELKKLTKLAKRILKNE